MYTSTDGTIVITVRQESTYRIAYALHVNGEYVCTKVLPRNNIAIVQNFGYTLEEFNT